jgi:hypothetical protein
LVMEAFFVEKKKLTQELFCECQEILQNIKACGKFFNNLHLLVNWRIIHFLQIW